MNPDLIAVIPIEVVLDKRLTLEQTRVLLHLSNIKPGGYNGATLSLIDKHGCESPKARGISRNSARCAAFSIPASSFGGSGGMASAMPVSLCVPRPLTSTRAATLRESGEAVVHQAQLEHSMSPSLDAPARHSPPGTSADPLESHIKHLGEQMLAAHARYEASGCFSDIGEAHACRIQMQRAISQRSPDYIVALEAKRGLICA